MSKRHWCPFAQIGAWWHFLNQWLLMTIWFLRLGTGNPAGFCSVVVHGKIYGNRKPIIYAVPGIAGPNCNGSLRYYIHQGWGLLNIFSQFRYFLSFSGWSKHWLPVWYHVHIWQVSPQLSCGDTWQIWTLLKISKLYFCSIKVSVTEKLTNGALVTPTPGSANYLVVLSLHKLRRRGQCHADWKTTRTSHDNSNCLGFRVCSVLISALVVWFYHFASLHAIWFPQCWCYQTCGKTNARI